MPRAASRSHPGMLRTCAIAGSIALTLSGCGGDVADGEEQTTAEPAESSTRVEQPTYDGPPSDLTSHEVCSLLDEADIEEMLNAEVSSGTPGSGQPDCIWTYRVPDGPATSLQVQVMSMDQTGNLYGTEALEWGLGYAPRDVEVTEVPALDVPNGSYEFGDGSVVFAVDPAGRLFTVSAHSDTPEEDRTAIVEMVLTALVEQHG